MNGDAAPIFSDDNDMTFIPDSGSRPFAEQRIGDDRLIGATLALSALYATVRYNVFKGVPWSDWPHFIGNKILATASLILIALAIVRLIRRRPGSIRRLVAAGSMLAAVHTMISLALCRPEYFDKFFAGQKLSLAGGVSLVVASLALVLLNKGKGKSSSLSPLASSRALAAIALLSGLHAALPSIASWLQPSTWPGGMPPITLLSFLIGSATFLLVHSEGWRWRRRAFAPWTGIGGAELDHVNQKRPRIDCQTYEAGGSAALGPAEAVPVGSGN